MNRRHFIASTALLPVGQMLPDFLKKKKTHVLTFSFDDGFKKSFYRIAEIHEEYGLKACLNVIAMGHVPGLVDDICIPQDTVGNFEDWNKLKGRGHEIMPHSWDHKRLTELPLSEAKDNLDQCFDYFEQNLDGYKPKEAIYNFAYNASNADLETYALKRARAIRTGGWMMLQDTKLNPIPRKANLPRLGCWGTDSDVCDDLVETEVNNFLASKGGWLILNLHGLDNEGWGPISTRYFDRLLKRLVRIRHLDILPAGVVLNC